MALVGIEIELERAATLWMAAKGSSCPPRLCGFALVDSPAPVAVENETDGERAVRRVRIME